MVYSGCYKDIEVQSRVKEFTATSMPVRDRNAYQREAVEPTGAHPLYTC
jgi:hypothetical protein